MWINQPHEECYGSGIKAREIQDRWGSHYEYKSMKSIAAERLYQSMIEKRTGKKKTDIDIAETKWQKLVGSTLVFSETDGYGGRKPKPKYKQHEAFRRLLYDVYPIVRRKFGGFEGGDNPAESMPEPGAGKPPGDGEHDCNSCGESLGAPGTQPDSGGLGGKGTCASCEEQGYSKGKPKEGKGKLETETKAEKPKEPPKPPNPPVDYFEWSLFVRSVCHRRAADGMAIDDWSMRPTIDGLKAIEAGAPIEAVKDAAAMHFPEDAREEIGVKKFDFTKHGIEKYLDTLVRAKIPIFLVGPKGTGKTTHAINLAERLGVPFGMASMTAATPPSVFYGKPQLNGDHTMSQYQLLFIGGGVYLHDEMDAADANNLLISNAPLANGKFSNIVTGEMLTRSETWIPVAAGNTLGLGADRTYTGRERQDGATLDRWNVGRVRVDLDPVLEKKLAEEITGKTL